MSALDPAAVDQWRSYVGRAEERRQILELESLRRFALAVDSDRDVERHMPPLGHWAFFLPEPEDRDLAPDGHPKKGGFLPPVTLPRRMFAGASIRFHRSLVLGKEAVMTSMIKSVEHKNGRSGELVFVTVERIIAQDDINAIAETQNYVFRGEGPPALLPEPSAHPIDGELWQPNEANLFRFSAATFNSHRIHYDLPYAQQEEGYPALIVHGPYIAARLAELAQREAPLTSFSFRAQAPIFLGQSIRLRRDGAAGEAIRCDGAVAMSSTATY